MSIQRDFLTRLGVAEHSLPCSTGQTWFGRQTEAYTSVSPVDNAVVGQVGKASHEDYARVIQTAEAARSAWAATPAPKRGDVVRQIGDALRAHKADLGLLVSYEMGKSYQEGLGEVQEMIDICDFALGQSRQLYGFTMHSERPEHRMYEQWHPMGLVGIITAFNFPVAVWAWNAMLALVCGDVSIWKPSEKVPLCAVACFKIIADVLKANDVPEGVLNLIVGDVETVGEPLISDARIPLISATGSTRMGQRVGAVVGARLGRSILELGGNNAIILTADADLKMALPAIVFGAVGTCGQRCTSTRRLIIHDSIYEQVKDSIIKAYQGLKIGSPLDEANHVGPLIDTDAVEMMQSALGRLKEEGATILYGGQRLSGEGFNSDCYVMPAVVAADNKMPTVQSETFAPILYLLRYSGGIEEAIALQNGVKQGLSSAIFSNNLRETERFLSALGSDCGIANVNIGTSGAEIGGAFGGEKETGGGRESGSDAWKGYMRRQTNTINYGTELPLAQGIKFEI